MQRPYHPPGARCPIRLKFQSKVEYLGDLGMIAPLNARPKIGVIYTVLEGLERGTPRSPLSYADHSATASPMEAYRTLF